MSFTKSDILHVPGASLYYEVCGNGPMLLLIHAGGSDARAFNGIVRHLARQYTVVSYDRRGLSRSKLDNPEEEQRVEGHSEDAHHLLAALTTEPAFVFGSSGGAIIGLDLVTRYPEQVHTLIAHEPPSSLLSGMDDFHNTIRETARSEGVATAMQKFIAEIGVTYDDMEPDVELPERDERSPENTIFLLKQEFAMYELYKLDLVVLKTLPKRTHILIGAGITGREHRGYQNAVAVADRLETTVVEFPGHHVGYVSHPRAFTAKLHEVLNNEQAR